MYDAATNCAEKKHNQAVYDDGMSPAVRLRKSRSHEDMVLPGLLLQTEMPQKNTFVHYDIPMYHSETSSDIDVPRPPTPTPSAPGILLRRLFKTKAEDHQSASDAEDKSASTAGHRQRTKSASDADTITELPTASSSNQGVLPRKQRSSTWRPQLYPDATRSGDDCECKFEQDSEASTTAAGSASGSPFDARSASASSLPTRPAASASSLGPALGVNLATTFGTKLTVAARGQNVSSAIFAPKVRSRSTKRTS